MDVSQNLIARSIQDQAQALPEGQLDREALIRYGREAATTTEKVRQFFRHCFMDIFKYGFEGARKKSEEYFIKKSVAIIQDINLKQLSDSIEGISPQEIMQYLGKIVENGDVLVEKSPHWQSIKSLHQSYRFLAETRANLEHHWIKDFANSQDLGLHLELIDPIENQEQVSRLLELNTLQREALTSNFNDLLTLILGSHKLRDMTDAQLNKFKICLNLDRNLSSLSKEERLEKTKQLFAMLVAIEEKGGSKARQAFQDLLNQNSDLQHLLLQLPPASVDTEKLLEIQNLCSQISPLPIDLTFSQTADEIIQKLKDELPQNKQETLAKRLGPEFAKSYTSLSVEDQATMDSSLATLRKIEEDYRLNGKSQIFLQSMKEAVGKGFKTAQEVAQVVEKLKSQDSLYLHLMTRLGEKIRKLLSVGISPQQVLEFQQKALQEAEPVALDWRTKIKEGIKEGAGKSDINAKFDEAGMAFNKAKLEKAKQEWMSSYGQDFVDSFLTTLGPEVEKGEVHYKEKQMASLKVIDRIFVQFNAHQLKLQYGPSLISHAMYYLLSPAGQDRVNDPKFLKQEWPALLKTFEKVRQRFFDQGVTSAEFEEALSRFLTQSPYAQTQGTSWLFLNDEPLAKFSASLQAQLTDKQLNEMMPTHGELFVKSLRAYLKENESDILEGKRPLKESLFNQASAFSDQVGLLMPYLVANFEPFGVLDKEILISSLLVEPITPQNLIIRSNNLNQLKELGKEYKSEREISLVREFIRDLNPPYLLDLNLDRQALQGPEREKDKKQQEVVQESVRKLVKFCLKTIDESQIYISHLLSQAIAELLKQKGNPQDPPVKRLNAVADECAAFFNSGIKRDFHSICFQLYVKEMAEKACEAQNQAYSSKVAQFVEGLLARFSEQQEGLQSSKAAEYINDLIQFAIMLSLTTEATNFKLFEALLSIAERPENHVLFQVKKINELAKDTKNLLVIPSDVKEQLINQLKSKTALKTAQSSDTLRAIQNNPFAIVEAFLPRFIENMLAPEDKDKVGGIRKALIPLAPLFNQSKFVRKGVEVLAQLTRLLPNAANSNDAKKLIVEQIKGFNQLDIEELAKLGNRNKIRQELDGKKLGLWEKVTNAIADNLFDAHAKIQVSSSDVKKLAESDMKKLTEPDVKKLVESAVKKLAESDPGVDFIYNTLPQIAEGQQAIQNWIKVIISSIPTIRKLGGGWLANQILKRYISSKLDKVEFLDAPTKKLASKSMQAIIETALLATPALVKNHNIPKYLDFFDRLNQMMKQDKEPNQEELFIEVMRVIQQLTRELEVYGPILEEAINHTLAQATLEVN